jgi:hypothetical protein
MSHATAVTLLSKDTDEVHVFPFNSVVSDAHNLRGMKGEDCLWYTENFLFDPLSGNKHELTHHHLLMRAALRGDVGTPF